jgi:heme-degrading monooxygenase HmoA
MPWRMLGTNSGPFNGLPPSGKAVSVAGVDIVKLSQDGLQSVVGYFDSRAVPQQLGLQVVVQPRSIGPFTFGVSTRVVSGRNATPQAFSVTSLEPRSEQEKEEIRLAGRETLKEMLGMEGFISATTVTCGNRQMTFTAWEKPENISQMRSSKHHSQATRGFYGTEFAQGGIISTWQMPTKVQTFQRCPECHKMIWVERTQGRCVCGASVEASNYW